MSIEKSITTHLAESGEIYFKLEDILETYDLSNSHLEMIDLSIQDFYSLKEFIKIQKYLKLIHCIEDYEMENKLSIRKIHVEYLNGNYFVNGYFLKEEHRTLALISTDNAFSYKNNTYVDATFLFTVMFKISNQ